MSKENDIISKVLVTTELFKGSFPALREAVLLNEYNSKCEHYSRLLVWKTCFVTESLNILAWEEKLLASRAVYHLLRRNPEMAVPWNKLERDSEFYAHSPSKSHPKDAARKLVRISNVNDDPLLSNGSTQSVVNTSLQNSDAELLEAIILDIKRLFPGEDFFNSTTESAHDAKRQLITILYTWCKCNPNVGYKQGIHEILGLIYLNTVKESVSLADTKGFTADELRILSLYNLQYLEHDTFALFNRFFVSSGIVTDFYETEARLMNSIESFNGLLMKVDQLIHYNLITKLLLDTPLWIIRFFRLMLLRELSNDLEVPSMLWDKFVAAELERTMGQTCLSELVISMTIIMLIHLKTELMLCDFSEALSLLLHYPITTKMHLHGDFISLLFHDAYHLRSVKDKDLKLYEYGIKLNKQYNSGMKVKIGGSGGSVTPSSPSVLSPKSSVDLPTLADSKTAKMKFEKNRLEMRLKKKAQEMINS